MDTSQVIAAEHAVWEAWRTRDLATIERLSAKEYVAVDAEGVVEWPQVVASLPLSRLVSYKVGEVTVKELAPTVIALAFQVQASLASELQAEPCCISVVSIWVQRGGSWLSILRHEVPLANR